MRLAPSGVRQSKQIPARCTVLQVGTVHSRLAAALVCGSMRWADCLRLDRCTNKGQCDDWCRELHEKRCQSGCVILRRDVLPGEGDRWQRLESVAVVRPSTENVIRLIYLANQQNKSREQTKPVNAALSERDTSQ